MSVAFRPASRPGGLREGGFTLLEVLVALVTVTIVLVAVFRLHSQTLQMTWRARFMALAPSLAEAKLGEMTVAGQSDWRDDQGMFDDPYSDYQWNMTVEEIDPTGEAELPEGLKRVDVVVRHVPSGYDFRLRQYLFLDEGE